MNGGSKQVRVGIIGASGYTGAELLRLLARHPRAEVAVVTAERHAGKRLGAVFPHLSALRLPPLLRVGEADWEGVDAVFCCLPHGTTQEVVMGLPDGLKVIDLSADFRLNDPALYAQWYGAPHRAPKLQREAVYGLPELAREAITNARLVACPGCYPTSALLALAPLLEAGLIDADSIVIDAKSGVSGAGRKAVEASLYTEVAEGMHAYGIACHRHAPEIEQELSVAAGKPVAISFTPHLVPMNRGILSTVYVRLSGGADAAALRSALAERYGNEPFVTVLAAGEAPHTRHVRGSNHCRIGVFADRIGGRAILVSVIDNLIKGASGQALQNMNLMLGLPETMGLEQETLFP
jgi:N-acetyl-gamma-glutamyl-phosphate reductase